MLITKLLTMWGVALTFVACIAAQVASHEIKVECHEFHDFPPMSNTSPSSLADLKVELVTVRESYMMNISWAINIDGSIKFLTGTRILLSEETYHCGYNPQFDKADLTGLTQIWFHHLVAASHGYNLIQAANLPEPLVGGDHYYKSTTVFIPKTKKEPTTVGHTTQEPSTVSTKEVPGDASFNSTVVAIFGGLASLMTLGCCYIIYKSYRANCATSLDFKMLPASPMVPVPILVVYPAENSAFQRAVVALVEFLQWHGGCSVAVDMWQQVKIAELGPMRWLAEQAKAADRVLIVCPQGATNSSQPRDSPLNHSLPESSIPAAAYDLYPLILNMVASHAKSASNLSKFWVVQLGEEKAKKPSYLALELRSCRTFCLMKDLIKLSRSLHTKRRDSKKISNQIFRPGIDKSTVKLREAVENLGRPKSSNVTEVEYLKSVATI